MVTKQQVKARTLKTRDVAVLAQVGTSAVHAAIHRGTLKARVTPWGHYEMSLEDVVAWLKGKGADWDLLLAEWVVEELAESLERWEGWEKGCGIS